MAAHDCDKCNSKGNCEIEDMFGKAKKAFAEKGLPGLVDLMVDCIKSPPEFGLAVRAITMVLDGNIDALYQFRILAYQNKDRFPLGAGEYGLNVVFTAIHKVLSEEIIKDAISLTAELADALGVKNHMTAMKLSGSQVKAMMESVGQDLEGVTKPTKPLVFH